MNIAGVWSKVDKDVEKSAKLIKAAGFDAVDFDLCEMVGCEPYLAGNLGSGTVEELSQWIEYITSDDISPMADLRRKNGREKAWKLKYLGIGNENWGCGGNMTPEYYSELYRRYQTYCRNYSGNDDRHPIPGSSVICVGICLLLGTEHQFRRLIVVILRNKSSTLELHICQIGIIVQVCNLDIIHLKIAVVDTPDLDIAGAKIFIIRPGNNIKILCIQGLHA